MAGREVLLAANSPEASLLAVCGSNGGPAQSELASQLCAVHKETKVNKVLVQTILAPRNHQRWTLNLIAAFMCKGSHSDLDSILSSLKCAAVPYGNR